MQAQAIEAQAYTQVGARGLTFTVQQVLVAVGLFYWNPVTSAWQPTAPTFNRGLLGGVRFRVTNNTGYAQFVRVESDIKKPDGTSTRYVGPTYSVSTGATQDWDLGFTADQVGTWQHNVGVYVGSYLDAMALTISQGWTSAAIVLAAAAGAITANEFQNPATGAWQSIAPSYIVGQTLTQRVTVRNDSGQSMRARVDVQITGPDGVVRTPTTNPQGVPVSEVGPTGPLAAGTTISWSGFTALLNQAGTWTITFLLYGELV